jgi:hypothetical protein
MLCGSWQQEAVQVLRNQPEPGLPRIRVRTGFGVLQDNVFFGHNRMVIGEVMGYVLYLRVLKLYDR